VPLWGTDLHDPAQIEPFILRGLRQLAAQQRLNGLLAPVHDAVPELAEPCV
jgi:hypothetical protein